MKQLNKAAVCTDIHFGKKNNSKLHNEDCIRYLKWFVSQVKTDPEIDHIMFLGDWNENRSALNIETLNYSYQGARLLNSIGLPVFFIIGNHDLYKRHARDIHSVIPYQELENFILVTEPTVYDNIGSGALICPYLFHEEYPTLKQYANLETWWGHFEFKGFVVTGYSLKMPVGPDPDDFKGPKHIFSGHFHKRQADKNIIYVGNTFPMDFGDAGDRDRGMMTFDHSKMEPLFINWPDCPTYIKTNLSDLVDGNVELIPEARVKCTVDVVVDYEESTALRNHFLEKYSLREFVMEESHELSSALVGTDAKIDEESIKLKSVNELVVDMLLEIDTDHIKNQLLVDIYQGLEETA